MKDRVYSDKVIKIFEEHLKQDGRPVLKLSIDNIMDAIDGGETPAKAIYLQSKLLRVPMYKLEDVMYEITGERYHSKSACFPKFSRRPYKKREVHPIIDKETGEVLSNMTISDNPPIKIITRDMSLISVLEPMQAQINLTYEEMVSLYKLFQTHSLQADVDDAYIILSTEPKKFSIKFLDEKCNTRMEIHNERHHPRSEEK